MSELHHEVHLEAYIVEKLAAQGWLVGESKSLTH
jgi:type I restriction enzyme R subunit